MKKLLSAVTSAVTTVSVVASAFASLPVSAAGSLSVSQPNFSMGEVLDVSANKTASDGSVEWLIPTVTAAPGQTVTIPVVAKNSSLAVAGAQFNVDAASPLKYKSVTGGDAYASKSATMVREQSSSSMTVMESRRLLLKVQQYLLLHIQSLRIVKRAHMLSSGLTETLVILMVMISQAKLNLQTVL